MACCESYVGEHCDIPTSNQVLHHLGIFRKVRVHVLVMAASILRITFRLEPQMINELTLLFISYPSQETEEPETHSNMGTSSLCMLHISTDSR